MNHWQNGKLILDIRFPTLDLKNRKSNIQYRKL